MAEPIKGYRPSKAPPGTLVAVPGEGEHTGIRLLEYRGQCINDLEITDLAQLAGELADGQPEAPVAWVHVIGLGNPTLLQGLADLFKLHPLAMEDVLNLGQRPKVEDYDDRVFVVLQHLTCTQKLVKATQISLFLSKDFVLTFQPGGEDLLAPLRTRICTTQGRVHMRAADYLAYTIIDLVVDKAFPVLEDVGTRLEVLENEVTRNPDAQIMTEIYHLQRQLLSLRRVLWPQREAVLRLLRNEEGLLCEDVEVYLRDSSDHAVQALDMVENYRETAASLLNVHLSNATNRLTNVMRVLTVIATIFTPPTFVASIYGMNFDRASPWNMPELGWEYGYLMVWGVVIAMVVGMLIFFRRKRWL
jgi:magnesium transporter